MVSLKTTLGNGYAAAMGTPDAHEIEKRLHIGTIWATDSHFPISHKLRVISTYPKPPHTVNLVSPSVKKKKNLGFLGIWALEFLKLLVHVSKY